MKKSTHEIVEGGNEIFEIAKNIKAWRNRYLTKHEKVEEARKEVLSLKEELLEIAQAMLNGDDGVERRDPGLVNKEIARAEVRLAKTEERNQADLEEMDALCEKLYQYIADPVPVESSAVEVPEEIDATNPCEETASYQERQAHQERVISQDESDDAKHLKNEASQSNAGQGNEQENIEDMDEFSFSEVS